MGRRSIVALTCVILLSAAIAVNAFRITHAKAAGVKFLTTRAPFTLVTSSILRDDAAPGDFVGNYVISAQTRDGSLYTETRFLLNRTSPKFVMKTLASAAGLTRSIFWSEEREVLGKPRLASTASAVTPRFPSPETGCVANSSFESVIGRDNLRIGHKTYPVFVLSKEFSDKEEVSRTTQYRAADPAFACLILRSSGTYTIDCPRCLSNGHPGSSQATPVSFAEGDPDPSLLREFEVEYAIADIVTGDVIQKAFDNPNVH